MSQKEEKVIKIYVDPSLDYLDEDPTKLFGSIVVDATRPEFPLPPGVTKKGKFRSSAFSGVPSPPPDSDGVQASPPERPTPAANVHPMTTPPSPPPSADAFLATKADPVRPPVSGSTSIPREITSSDGVGAQSFPSNVSTTVPTSSNVSSQIPAMLNNKNNSCRGCSGNLTQVVVAVEDLVSFTMECHDAIIKDHFLVLVNDENESVSFPERVKQGTKVAVHIVGSDKVHYVELIGVKFLHLNHVYRVMLLLESVDIPKNQDMKG